MKKKISFEAGLAPSSAPAAQRLVRLRIDFSATAKVPEAFSLPGLLHRAQRPMKNKISFEAGLAPSSAPAAQRLVRLRIDFSTTAKVPEAFSLPGLLFSARFT